MRDRPLFAHFAPNTPRCILSCIDQHELSHAEDALKSNPDICKGKADGTQVTMSPSEQKGSEQKGSAREIDCLKVALKCPTPDCPADALNARIKRIQDYHDSF